MKEWYTAQELTDLQLNSLPKSKSNVISRAKKDSWINRKRTGKGGGLEYAFSGLPKEVQTEIKAKELRALMPKPNSQERTVALMGRDLDELTDKDRQIADMRMLMALLVADYEDDMGRTRAIEYVSKLSRENALPVIDGKDYNQICAFALAKHNRIVGVGTRKLHQWVLDANKCHNGAERLRMLAPQTQGKPQTDITQVTWLPYFLAVYRNPNGISLSRAYEDFAFNYAKLGRGVPSVNQVRHVFDRLPKLVRERGRVTGSRYKQLRSYVKRDWNPDWMMANDIWVGDGHAMKVKVKHPIHGRDFMPEITLIMDAPSRMIVGWSLGLSESHLAVADALRHAMINHGVPAIYYSDNGSGQSNEVMDNPLTGILPRMGIEHATGIPGNPQGRGIIERAMKEVPNRIAQRFATYFGTGADSDTVRKNLYAVQSYSNALEKGKSTDELTDIQKKGQQMLPSWQELLDAIDEEVYRYNHFHQHSQIKSTPIKKRTELIEQLKSIGEDISPLSEIEARDMFRPRFVRRVQRGRIDYATKSYGNERLEYLDGQDVQIDIDIHDPSMIVVRDMNGQYICDAHLDWKTCDAFPQSYVETARAKRQAGVKRRAQDKIDRIDAENRQVIEHKNSELFAQFTQAIDAECREIGQDDDDDFVIFEHQLENRRVV